MNYLNKPFTSRTGPKKNEANKKTTTLTRRFIADFPQKSLKTQTKINAMTRYLIDGLIQISTKTWRSESRNRKLCSFSYTRCDTSKSIFGKTTKIIETDIRAITKRVILDELNFFVIIKFIQVDSCLI